MSKKTWTTRDGVKIEISKMKTSHIKNCIKMLTKKMPNHEDDEVIIADLPESMWGQPCMYREPGAKQYREKISELTSELVKRNEL